MGTLANLLMSLGLPLAVRILTGLGVGTLTFTGVTVALQGLISMAQTSWSGLGADVLGLASIAGVPQGLGIVAGAMTTRVGIWVTVSATKWILSPAS
jgi:hypothetical protein